MAWIGRTPLAQMGEHPLTRQLIAATALALCALGASSLNATTYIAFGDSITRGDGGPGSPEFDFDETGNGYPARLQRLLQAGDKVRNEGIGSLDTMEARSHLQGALARGGDVLLLMLGTNDTKQISIGTMSVETVRANLDNLRQIASGQGVPTIMATIIPRKPTAKYDGSNTITFEIVKAIREMESKSRRMPLADAWETFARIPSQQRYKDFYSKLESTLGHPNGEGFQLIAQVFADVIQGVDRLEPLLASFSIASGATEVSKKEKFSLVLYDHLSGVDRNETTFLVNGKVAEDTVVTSTGDRKKATVTLKLSKFKDCKLRLELQTQDQAEPPNILDFQFPKDYRIKGRGFKKGDVNFDCRVDGIDLVLFSFHFGTSAGDSRYDPAADFDLNGKIGRKDRNILKKNFGKTAK